MDGIVGWLVACVGMVTVFIIIGKKIANEIERRHITSETEWENLIHEWKQQDLYDKFYG